MRVDMSSIKAETHKWSREVVATMIRLDNAERRRRGLDLLTSEPLIGMPEGPVASLALMNYKVWAARCGVSLDFVLEAVFFKWRYKRKMRKGDVCAFGLQPRAATGEETRHFVEETVARAYPCGENRRRSPQFLPVESNGHRGMDDFLESYGKEMRRRQVAFAEPEPRGERNHRR